MARRDVCEGLYCCGKSSAKREAIDRLLLALTHTYTEHVRLLVVLFKDKRLHQASLSDHGLITHNLIDPYVNININHHHIQVYTFVSFHSTAEHELHF